MTTQDKETIICLNQNLPTILSEVESQADSGLLFKLQDSNFEPLEDGMILRRG